MHFSSIIELYKAANNSRALTPPKNVGRCLWAELSLQPWNQRPLQEPYKNTIKQQLCGELSAISYPDRGRMFRPSHCTKLCGKPPFSTAQHVNFNIFISLRVNPSKEFQNLYLNVFFSSASYYYFSAYGVTFQNCTSIKSTKELQGWKHTVRNQTHFNNSWFLS